MSSTHTNAPLSALEAAVTPAWLRRLARRIRLTVFVLPLLLLLVPWQQTIQGYGRVVAYDSTERPQVVTAPISGRVMQWAVVEGQRVGEGDVLVELADPDPLFVEQLANRRRILDERRADAEKQIASQAEVLTQAGLSRGAAIAAAKADAAAARQEIAITQQSLAADVARRTQARETFDLVDQAVRGGLQRGQERINQQAALLAAEAKVMETEARIARARQALAAADERAARADYDAAERIAQARREISGLEERVLGAIDTESQRLESETRRYEQRFVRAPTSGTILRIDANVNQGGAFVKETEPLATIVPDVSELVVELAIDGVDAPLIYPDADGTYPLVRLQFEGWPAIQFTGWPSATYGTFGGRIRQVDRADNGKGQFRVFVQEDTSQFARDVWPSGDVLRHGNQAVGWVLLNRVTLGWELWRRFNGFPPVLGPEDPSQDKDGGGKSKDRFKKKAK
jgi:membrane fusion protein, adhesin transport system